MTDRTRGQGRGGGAQPEAPSTRERILAAAVEVFSSKGYRLAAVDDIVNASGTSKGAFYFYFKGKEALFLGLVDDFVARLQAAVIGAAASPGGARARVEAALRAGIRVFAENPRLTRLFLVEAVGLSPELEERRRATHKTFAALIRGYLEEAQADGDIPRQDLELLAFAWLGAIVEVVVHYLHEGRRAELARAIPQLAAFALRGAGWRGGGGARPPEEEP